MQLSFDFFFFRFIKFHINCLNTIFIFNIGVCSFHQTNKEKSFDTDLFRFLLLVYLYKSNTKLLWKFICIYHTFEQWSDVCNAWKDIRFLVSIAFILCILLQICIEIYLYSISSQEIKRIKSIIYYINFHLCFRIMQCFGKRKINNYLYKLKNNF